MRISSSDRSTRREFLQEAAFQSGAAMLGTSLIRPTFGLADDNSVPRKKLRVAAVFTSFYYRSHAHDILENFLEPYLFNGKLVTPPAQVVSFFADQLPENDMARPVAKEYGIPLYKTIDEALCVGGKELACDAVLLIGEHGEYPVNDLGQREYPRKRFFDEAVAVMRRTKRFVPVFNDKHLSFRWDWAKEMYDTAKELGIPLMAGSSVPLAQRVPPLEVPANAEFSEVVSIHGGGIEGYDFHGLEVLQSVVESRKGGETGISRVEFLSGNALWKAADKGQWSFPLAEAVLTAESSFRTVPVRELISQPPHGILLEYKDGLRAAVIKIGQSPIRWGFGYRLKGSDAIHATYVNPGSWNNRGLFRALSHAIQDHFLRGRPPYPVERTLLVTGALDAAMHSRQDEKAIETPQLEFAYSPRDFRGMREMGETWKIVTDKTPQPPGIKRDPPGN